MTLKPPDEATLPTSSRTEVLFEAPLNVNYPEYGGNLSLAHAAAYNAGGGEIYVPPGEYTNVHVVRNWTTSTTVNILGGGKKSTVLIPDGVHPALDFSASVSQLETYSDVRDLSIRGTGKTCSGIKLDGNARLRLNNLDIRGCSKAVENLGGLVLDIAYCTLQQNATGLYNRLSAQPGGPPPNLITVRGCQIVGNTTLGIDHGDGMMLVLCDGTNVETNGTAANTATGGLSVQATVDDAIGYGQVIVRDSWFEGNLGRSIQAAGGDLLLDGVNIISAESGRSVYARNCRRVSLREVLAPSVGDTADVNSSNVYGEIVGGLIHTVTSFTPATAYVRNVQDSTGERGLFSDMILAKGKKIQLTWSAGVGVHTIEPNTVSGELEINAHDVNAVKMLSPLKLAAFTVATRPVASSYPGATIYVSDAAAGAKFQGSDGSAWVNLG